MGPDHRRLDRDHRDCPSGNRGQQYFRLPQRFLYRRRPDDGLRAVANSDTDSYTYAYTYTNSCAHTDTDSDSNGHSYANSYSHVYANGNSYGHGNADSYGHVHGDTDSYGPAPTPTPMPTPTPAYNAQIRPPINADGTSIFNANRGVIPVKCTLTQDGSPTCALPPATIALTRTADGNIGPINESVYVMSADNGSNFRIDDCQ